MEISDKLQSSNIIMLEIPVARAFVHSKKLGFRDFPRTLVGCRLETGPIGVDQSTIGCL